jgi:peptidoglycan/xylan/chitin deacetylase (PgdA/CDA1 family)
MRPRATSESAGTSNGAGRPAAAGLSAGFKEKCRCALANCLYHTGLLRVARRFEGTHQLCSVSGSRWPRLRRFPGPKFGILCYHRVGTEGVPLYSRLEPAVFEAQMRYIREHYRVVSLGQLCLELQEARSVEPTLAVTFDDGYRDLHTYAYPVLQKYRIPATIYLIARCMETGEAPWYDRIFAALQAAPGPILEVELDGPRSFALSSLGSRSAAAWEIICYLRTIPDVQRQDWCAAFEKPGLVPEKEVSGRMLDWQQVQEMQRGGVHFGAHTMTHPAVSRLEPAAFAEEMANSKQILESGLGAPVVDFAYPFGKDSDRSGLAETFLRGNGYRSAATTVDGYNAARTNLFKLHRRQIGDDRSVANFAFDLARMFIESESDSPSATVNNSAYSSEAARAQANQSSR